MDNIAEKVKTTVNRPQEVTNELLLTNAKQQEEIIAMLGELIGESRQLNEYKKQQLEGDNIFRELYKAIKASDRRTTILMVLVTSTAFLLQIIQLEDFFIIQQRIAMLIEPLFNMIGDWYGIL